MLGCLFSTVMIILVIFALIFLVPGIALGFLELIAFIAGSIVVGLVLIFALLWSLVALLLSIIIWPFKMLTSLLKK